MRRELQTAAMDSSIEVRQGVVVAVGCDVLFQQPPNLFNGIELVSAVGRQVYELDALLAGQPGAQSSTGVKLSLQMYTRTMLSQNTRLHYLGRLAQEYALVQHSRAGEPVPADVGYDRSGAVTTDPAAILDGGAIRTFDRCAGPGWTSSLLFLRVCHQHAFTVREALHGLYVLPTLSFAAGLKARLHVVAVLEGRTFALIARF